MSDPLATTYEFTVTLQDGRALEVRADQRDIAAFECEPFGVGFFRIAEKPLTFARYMAWRGGKRDKLHAYSWDEWGDVCVSVVEKEEPEDGADPGMTAASAEV